MAALFAWHPLHVESVAWVAERKDVLSGFFWLLTLWAYWHYARQPSRRGYVLTLLLFACGLMSKPMVVTLPFVLLLLDYWPLGRGAHCWSASASGILQLRNYSPALVAAAARKSSVLPAGCRFQRHHLCGPGTRGGAMSFQAALTLQSRAANALISYARYLQKTFWPVDLVVFYPHPLDWPVWEVFGAAVLLVAVTIVVFVYRSRQPWLLVGWCWFLGTLVPVIGLVQVGLQSMADRYTYLPLIGVFIMLAWGGGALAARWPQFGKFAPATAAAALLACLGLTWFQVGTWRDSATLSRHAINVMPDNFVAHDNLGHALARLGRTNEAIAELNIGIRLQPASAVPYHLLGGIYEHAG